MQKLIKLSDTHYIIVDDSEIKVGNIVCEKLLTGKYELFIIHTINDIDVKTQKKITHSTQPLEEVVWWQRETRKSKLGFDKIKQLSLSEVEELIYGYSVEKMAIRKYGTSIYSIEEVEAFKAGFKAHQELVKDKLFTVEQVKKYHNIMCLAGNVKGEEYLRSLLPKTEWDITFDEQSKIKLL